MNDLNYQIKEKEKAGIENQEITLKKLIEKLDEGIWETNVFELKNLLKEFPDMKVEIRDGEVDSSGGGYGFGNGKIQGKIWRI